MDRHRLCQKEEGGEQERKGRLLGGDGTQSGALGLGKGLLGGGRMVWGKAWSGVGVGGGWEAVRRSGSSEYVLKSYP